MFLFIIPSLVVIDSHGVKVLDSFMGIHYNIWVYDINKPPVYIFSSVNLTWIANCDFLVG